MRYTLDELVSETKEIDRNEGIFELETPRTLEVNLNGDIWAKAGSMVAYTGDIKFERERLREQGLGTIFKKAFTGEGASLMKASGEGKLYLADNGKRVIILELQNDAIVVNGNDLLAFEPSIQHDIKMMKKVAGMLAGGLFNVRCEGTGLVAITAHYEPLTLAVRPGKPIITDPNATVAWSGNLEPVIQTDMTLRTFIGRGSGDSIQMRFEGTGFVIVQPYEEVYMQMSQG